MLPISGAQHVQTFCHWLAGFFGASTHIGVMPQLVWGGGGDPFEFTMREKKISTFQLGPQPCIQIVPKSLRRHYFTLWGSVCLARARRMPSALPLY